MSDLNKDLELSTVFVGNVLSIRLKRFGFLFTAYGGYNRHGILLTYEEMDWSYVEVYCPMYDQVINWLMYKRLFLGLGYDKDGYNGNVIDMSNGNVLCSYSYFIDYYELLDRLIHRCLDIIRDSEG